MSERLLCERDVLVKLSWPSRRYLDARMRKDRFPAPKRSSHGIGDQWLESDIDRWLGVAGAASARGEEMLLERFG